MRGAEPQNKRMKLTSRGYSAAMTPGNAVAIDLFAERGERTVNVQIKAIRHRKSLGWPLCPRAAGQEGLSVQRLLRVSPSRWDRVVR